MISYHPGYLQDRLELASYLWRHNISADVMYESAITNVETSVTDTCKTGGYFVGCQAFEPDLSILPQIPDSPLTRRPKRDQITVSRLTRSLATITMKIVRCFQLPTIAYI